MTDKILTPLLDVRNLSIAFSNVRKQDHTFAVDDVSFTLESGKCLALVGESGSGKSVTALSILRLLAMPPASHPSGEIYFKGEDVLKLSDANMRALRGKAITMVFQEPMTSLNPLHSIEKQIAEILLLHTTLTRQ